MAPWPRWHTGAVLLLSLFLVSVVSHAGKEAAASSGSHAELQDQEQHQLDEEAMSLTAVDERCGGGAGGGAEGEGEEECLMRRTLVAHTDYIYTQGGGHN